MSDDNVTESMRLNIMAALKADYMMEALPELKSIKAFVDYMQKGDKNVDFKRKVIAYIVLIYSKDSVLNVEPMPSLRERQLKAAEMVKFTKNGNGEFKLEVKDSLFSLEDDKGFYKRMVLEFLVRQNDMLWEQIMIDEHYRLSLMDEMISTDSDDKAKDRTATLERKSKLSAEIKNIRKSLIDQYKELFRDAKQVVELARQEILMTSLEKLAE